MSGLTRRIASNFLYTRKGIVPNPVVTIDLRSGIITDVEHWHNIDSEPFTEFYSGLMVPSFVNAHTHLELAALKGKIAEKCGNAGFAALISPLRRSITSDYSRKCMQEQDAEMWESGTGYVMDISNDASSFFIKERSLMKYHTFLECFGLKKSNLESQLKLKDRSRTLSPHSMYAIQESDLRKVVLENDGPLSIHFGESPDEDALFDGCGRLAEWYRKENFQCDFMHYGSITQRLLKTVPKDRKVALVHCSHICMEDIERIMSHFNEVYWVLCPRSNRYISSFDIECSDVWKLRQKLNICFGTDSLASNHSAKMLDEVISLNESSLFVLKALTETGYAFLGVDDRAWIEKGNHGHLSIISGIDSKCSFTEKTKITRII